MNNLMLFGAGASFGSDDNGTPPLATSLFNELARFNPPGWGALPSEFELEFNSDFELGMLKVADERPHDLPILQRTMASFFFNFRPRNTNLYYRLATRLIEVPRNIVLSTLNYERLLELSFFGAGHTLGIGEVSGNTIELVLPHGCCHLFCEAVRGSAGAVSFAGLNVQINGEIRVISNPTEFQQRINSDAFPPVMSYFEPNKRATAGQVFLNGQRERYNALISNADVAIVVGAKIREHDSHIWDAIKNTNAKFVYCSGSVERSVFNEWVARYRSRKENVFVDGYWGDAFDQVYDEIV